MNISILLPYKENYSPTYPGAVSLFINSTTKISKFRNNIKIYGSTNLKKSFQKIMLTYLYQLINFLKVKVKNTLKNFLIYIKKKMLI